MYTNFIALDLNTNTPFVLKGAKQGDRDSRQIKATILKDGEPYTIPAGTTASYRLRRPDGEGNWGVAEIENQQKVVFTLTAYDLALSGRAQGDIVLRNGTSILGTCNFIIDIQAAPTIGESAIKSQAFEYLRSIVDAAMEMINSAEAWAVGTRNGVPVSAGNSTEYTVSRSSNVEAIAMSSDFAQYATPSNADIYYYKYDTNTEQWINTYNNTAVTFDTRFSITGFNCNDSDYVILTKNANDPTYKNNSKYYANLLANAKVGTVTNIPASSPSAQVIWNKVNDCLEFNFNIPTIVSTGPAGLGIASMEATDSSHLRVTYTDGHSTTLGPFSIITLDTVNSGIFINGYD